MKIQNIKSNAFVRYGHIIEGYNTTELLNVLAKMNCPENSVVYVPEEPEMQNLSIQQQICSNVYGGMPIQMGYCNGNNRKLNCLEYHRGSETIVSVEDIVLLVASLQDVTDNKLDTSKVEAFLLPAGQMITLYETTLHYAPCTAENEKCFHTAIILPKGTNTDKPEISVLNNEDKLLWAANKWLLAHPDTSEAKQGAYIGLTGANIEI